MIISDLTDLIGSTPLLQARNIAGLKARLLLKVESFNPGGSVKDRAAFSMIIDAETSGILLPGATIIEPTSGNTGIGLAWVGRARGYHVVLTMPDTMSAERRSLLKAYGAEICLTPGAEGMAGAIRKAEELRQSILGSVILGQFSNPSNPLIHEWTTAEEIWADCQGCVDVFVAGVGTGGTISGVGRALRRHNPNVKIVAVEPASSPVLSGGQAGPHAIQGIGAGFVPAVYDPDVVSAVVSVSDADAVKAVRQLASSQGLLAGISSGAAFSVALHLAQQDQYQGKTVVALLPDSGERYLSLGLWEDRHGE